MTPEKFNEEYSVGDRFVADYALSRPAVVLMSKAIVDDSKGCVGGVLVHEDGNVLKLKWCHISILKYIGEKS